VKRYYTKGIMLNHAALEAALPGYVDRVRRIYTHQASPALVEKFARLAALPSCKAPTNARDCGNLVSASTVKMLHDDLSEVISQTVTSSAHPSLALDPNEARMCYPYGSPP
jgi:3-oxoacyl-[acyl-carrier-protein] synthase-3